MKLDTNFKDFPAMTVIFKDFQGLEFLFWNSMTFKDFQGACEPWILISCLYMVLFDSHFQLLVYSSRLKDISALQIFHFSP